MKWCRSISKKATEQILKSIRLADRGVALILTLLILLTLVLLGLALLIQTDTEYLIAINEQDSIETFHYAEAGMNWSKRVVLDVADAGGFADFSDLLDGPDNADNTADDNLLALKTIDTSLSGTSALVLGNEQATSVIVSKDFGDGSKSYEAFRIGIDQDGDNIWDGPRALVYTRIDDNYDEYPSTNAPLADTDQTITATVVSEFPIFVDSTGVASPGTRTVARRHLTARFGNQNQQPAILARRSILIQGNPAVCGECGSVHANQNIYGGGDIKVCQDLTASVIPASDFAFNVSGSVVGDESGGGFDEIEVPVINPYDEVMVPEPSVWSSAQDFAGLDCNADTPKYYAFVSNTNKGLVFKGVWTNTARPDGTTGGWKWKLIDDLNDSSNTRLDDCGRVICGTVNGVSVHEIGDGVCNGGENWLNDDKDDEFYGFKQSDPFTSTSNCSGDVTLSSSSPIADNDFNTVNFYCSTPNTFCGTDNTISTSNRLLPGGFDKDGARDFQDNRFEDGKARWTFSQNLTYSPVFNAVIWVWGRVDISGNPGTAGKICTSTSSGVANKKCEESDSALLSTVGNFWRVSFIAVNSIVVSGEPKYSTATPAFSFLMIAGRDIMISGNPASSETICQPNTGECARNLANSAEFAGIIAAHEQIKMNGNFSFDGFMIIEDAVDCTQSIAKRETSTGSPIDWSGNPNIHYDCVHPPNPWAGTVKMTSWQEVQ